MTGRHPLPPPPPLPLPPPPPPPPSPPPSLPLPPPLFCRYCRGGRPPHSPPTRPPSPLPPVHPTYTVTARARPHPPPPRLRRSQAATAAAAGRPWPPRSQPPVHPTAPPRACALTAAVVCRRRVVAFASPPRPPLPSRPLNPPPAFLPPSTMSRSPPSPPLLTATSAVVRTAGACGACGARSAKERGEGEAVVESGGGAASVWPAGRKGAGRWGAAHPPVGGSYPVGDGVRQRVTAAPTCRTPLLPRRPPSPVCVGEEGGGWWVGSFLVLATRSG